MRRLFRWLLPPLGEIAELAAKSTLQRTLGVLLPIWQSGRVTWRHKQIPSPDSRILNTDDRQGWLTVLVWREDNKWWVLQRKHLRQRRETE